MSDRRLLALDAAAVIAFVAIGREEHDGANGLAGLLSTVWPFLAAVVVGWLVTGAQRTPLSLRTGTAVAVVTVAVGMLLRRVVVGDGTAAAFVVVATVFLTATMLGWRAAVGAVRRRRAAV